MKTKVWIRDRYQPYKYTFIFLVFLEHLGLYLVSSDYLSVSIETQTSVTGELKNDWCTEKKSFKLITHITLYQCGEECMRRSRCLSILYLWEMRSCRLRSESNVALDSTLGLYRLCLSSDILTWDFSVIGKCSLRPCDYKSRCYVDSVGNWNCNITECLDPPSIPAAKKSSSVSDIMSTMTYFCDQPNTKVGHSMITCNGRGEWISPDFKCYPRCELVSPLQNAVLNFKNSHIYVINESVEYDCIDGYYREESYIGTPLVCDENGDWSTPQCAKFCPEPPDIYHGTKSQLSSDSPYKAGDIYVVLCDNRYKSVHEVSASNTNTMRCGGNGEWSLNIVCIPSAPGYKYDKVMELAYKVSMDIQTRDQAVQLCLFEGAELFVVRNATDFQFGKNLAMRMNLQTLIVANDNTNIIDQSFWSPGEPSFGSNTYAFYDAARGYLWNDYPAEHQANYLCVDRQLSVT